MAKPISPKHLAQAMENKNLCRNDIIKKIGMSKGTLSALLDPEKDANLSSEYLKLLCNELEVSADYLLGLSDISSVDLDIKDISNKLGLTEKSINTLLEAIKIDKKELEYSNPEDDEDINYFNYHSLHQAINELLESKVFFPLMTRLREYTHVYDFCTYEDLAKQVISYSNYSYTPIDTENASIEDIEKNLKELSWHELHLMNDKNVIYPKSYLYEYETEIVREYGAKMTKDIAQLSLTNILNDYYKTSNTYISNTLDDIDYLHLCLKELELIDYQHSLIDSKKIMIIKKRVEDRIEECQERLRQLERYNNKQLHWL